jgi:PAS domain S-box-containing protein
MRWATMVNASPLRLLDRRQLRYLAKCELVSYGGILYAIFGSVLMPPIFDKVYAPLLDALPDAVILVDEAGSILFANTATKDLLDYNAEELINQPMSVLIPPGHRESHAKMVIEFWRSPAPRAMSSRPILYALSKTGDEIPVSISLGPVTLNGRRCCVVVLRDASSIRNHLTSVLGGIQV